MATFERIHKKLLEFCSTDSQDCPVSERILTEYISFSLLIGVHDSALYDSAVHDSSVHDSAVHNSAVHDSCGPIVQ